MAVLSGKTSDGRSAWDKYVKSNPKYQDIIFTIENKMNAFMLDTTGKRTPFQLNEKEQFKIVSQNIIRVGNLDHAKILYKNIESLIPINRIRKPTNTDVLKEEAIALENLDKLIKNINTKVGPFELVIKGDPTRTVYKDIIGTRNVTEKVLGREAKSDFNIVSKTGDSIFISHKKAGGAEAFQQYGGVSAQAGSKIQRHPEVLEFLRKVINYIENDKLIHPVYSFVIDPRLINMAVYGHDFGSAFGIDNVTIIGQGDVIIKILPNFKNRFKLYFSSHLVHNGNADEFMYGSYKAVLGATFRAGRGFDVDGKRYTGARIGIYPAKLIVNRNSAKEI
jgi:hypothetical protein